MPLKDGDVSIKTSVSRETRALIQYLADIDNVSVSAKVRELLLDRLETIEDMILDMFANERSGSYDRQRSLSLRRFKREFLKT